jgi:hypothetical protein
MNVGGGEKGGNWWATARRGRFAEREVNLAQTWYILLEFAHQLINPPSTDLHCLATYAARLGCHQTVLLMRLGSCRWSMYRYTRIRRDALCRLDVAT